MRKKLEQSLPATLAAIKEHIETEPSTASLSASMAT
jgi:hypothetical protein